MSQIVRLGLAGLAALLWLGCSDDSSGPEPPGPPEPQGLDELPQLIVSEPFAGGLGTAGTAAYVSGDPSTVFVSLPPGTLIGALTVVIRNVTSDGAAIGPVPVLAGGFDPVPILAAADDTLEIAITDAQGGLSRKYGTVPKSRPPVVVRVSPPNGRTDVALGIRPAVVFSEPLDGTTLRAGIQLVAGDIPVDGELSLTPGKPWVADLAPASPLIPSTTYRLSITREVRDLAGEALDDPVTVTFTTVAAPPPPEPPPAPAGTERIAFTSTRDGASAIYLANTDGSGVVRLTTGRAPRWSPDGSRLAFQRFDGPVDSMSVINADGSGEYLLGPGFEPNWSPDGTRIAFWDYSGIWVMNADGSGRTPLLRGAVCLVPGYEGCSVSSPAWSPDGQSIAFTLMAYEQCGAGCGWPAEVSWLGLMGADGTNPHVVDIQFASGESASLNWARPIWSPDGSRIAWATWYANESLQVSRYAVVSVSPSGADFQVDYLAPQGWAAHAAAPDWSPDGRAMLFEIYEFVSGGVELSGPTRIFVTEGGTDRQLIPGVAAPANPDYRDSDPAWSRVTE